MNILKSSHFYQSMFSKNDQQGLIFNKSLRKSLHCDRQFFFSVYDKVLDKIIKVQKLWILRDSCMCKLYKIELCNYVASFGGKILSRLTVCSICI